MVLTDFQAVCEEKSGVNSRGTSFLLRVSFCSKSDFTNELCNVIFLENLFVF